MRTTLHLLVVNDTTTSAISIVNRDRYDINAISDHLDEHLGPRKRMIGFGKIVKEKHD